MNRLRELKIKEKSLAAEAKIIRREENKAKRNYQWVKGQDAENYKESWAEWMRLKRHRTYEVRREARATHLARGFLRGTPLIAMEAINHEDPNWYKVENLVKRFSGEDERVVLQRFAAWKDEGMSVQIRKGRQ